MPEAGWYRDPDDPSADEYWDGQTWTGHRRRAAYAQATNVSPAMPALGQAPLPPPVWQPAPPPRRRGAWIAVAVVVVLAAAAGIAFVVWPRSAAPAITYSGKPIAAPDAVLSRAQRALHGYVSHVHGAQNSSTRCYFAQPKQPGAGEKRSDVVDSLTCGPVLFLDGRASREYLTIPLDANAGGAEVRLRADLSDLGSSAPIARPASLDLVRPDGRTPPAGDGGLTVPRAPAGPRNSIVAADLGAQSVPTLPVTARMRSKNVSVTLVSAGRVSSYGTGSAQRSAPRGQKLIAFQLSRGSGALGFAVRGRPVLAVDGTTHTIPAATGSTYDVASVPLRSHPVVRLSEDGFVQTLSLPEGEPGPRNIAVLARSDTTGLLDSHFRMRSTYRKNGNELHTTITVTASNAGLTFWPAAFPSRHPSRPDQAYLFVGITYTDPRQSGKIGFAPDLLKLTLPNGSVMTPKNIARPGRVFDVFTVPASFTSGTLTISGSATVAHGIRQTLGGTRTVRIAIPSG